jgi:DNA polymerase I-like protein with 3'-5' exonuclease and polymerase domains
LIYGAGAKAISKQAGCSIDEAKKFVDVFYGRYKSVATWHKEFASTAEIESGYDFDGEGFREKTKTFIYRAETGRKFAFKEYHSDNEWSSRTYNFSPTELKNYPVQGLATGDIVPMMLGIIFRQLEGRDDVKMVNTIHDSLMFDVQHFAVDEFIKEITTTLKDTHKYFEEIFKKPLALKLNAGASVGKNWFEMKEL